MGSQIAEGGAGDNAGEVSPSSGFSWVDLTTDQPEAAQSFYGALLDWEFAPFDAPGRPYWVARVQDAATAGLFGHDPELRQQGIVPHWQAYVEVQTVDGSVELAQQLGAEILVEPLDAPGRGRMAVLLDPAGSLLSLWQVGHRPSYETSPATLGGAVWHQLWTPDVLRATQFYARLFGWRPQRLGGRIALYAGTVRIGAIGELDAANPTPGWLPCFRVSVLARALDRARRLGGSPTGPTNQNSFTVIQDAQGARFGITDRESLASS